LEQWRCPEGHKDSAPFEEGIHLVYLGNLDGSRGLDVVVRAVRHLKNSGPLVKVTVIGDGPGIQHLRALACELNVADRVEITGRLSFSQVQAIMAQAHVGLIPHYSTRAWNSTIPNKLFDYMSLGLPVIVSDAKPTARIVRREDCGEVFRDRDEIDLTRCIIALADHHARKVKGANGRAAIHNLYNWNRDCQILVRTVETVRAQYGQKIPQNCKTS
jgi:glycosyltransferase involved in cell wall biosynthesis